MAYVYKKPGEEEGGDQTDQAPALGTASADITGSGGPTGEAVAKAPMKDPIGQGVPDIGKYLTANQDKARALAGKVGGVISGDINKANTGITGAQNQFQSDVNKNTVNFNQDVYNQGKAALTNPNAANVVSDTAAQKEYNAKVASAAASSPVIEKGIGGETSTTATNLTAPATSTLVAPTPTAAAYTSGQAANYAANNQDVFKQQYNAQYAGPQDIQSQQYYQDANTAATKANATAAQIAQEQGRQELIARAQNTTGRFSRGALALDQAILAKDPVAFKQLQDAAAGAPELQSKLDALKSLGDQLVSKAKEATSNTRTQYRNEFDVQKEEGEIQQAYNLVKDQVAKGLETRKAEVAKMAPIEGADPMAFFNAQYGAGLNQYNTATQNDVERLKALEQLTGVQSTYNPYYDQAGKSANYTDTSKAFDEEAYKQQIASNLQSRMSYEAAQAEAARQIQAQKDAEAKAQADMVANLATSNVAGILGAPKIVQAIANPVSLAAPAVSNAVASVFRSFCFAPETLVAMANGIDLPIMELAIGDEVFLGGRVTAITMQKRNDALFSYPARDGDVLVTGTHAVLEYGSWKRVRESIASYLPEGEIDCPIVVSVTTEYHRLHILGQIFADQDEVDEGYLMDDETTLKMLNNSLVNKDSKGA